MSEIKLVELEVNGVTYTDVDVNSGLGEEIPLEIVELFYDLEDSGSEEEQSKILFRIKRMIQKRFLTKTQYAKWSKLSIKEFAEVSEAFNKHFESEGK